MNKLSDLVAERQATATKPADLDARIVLALAALHQSAVPQDRDLLTAAQAARKRGISRVFLCEKARCGEIKSVRAAARSGSARRI
jgi:hypothetical protein